MNKVSTVELYDVDSEDWYITVQKKAVDNDEAYYTLKKEYIDDKRARMSLELSEEQLTILLRLLREMIGDEIYERKVKE